MHAMMDQTDMPDAAPALPSPFPWRTLGLATIAVGALDGLDGAVYQYVSNGLTPFTVFRYIASGLLGASAFHGGLGTVALGGAIHFALSAFFAALFLVLYRARAVVRTNWVASGLAFGAAVWALMTFVVLPQSGVAPSTPTVADILNGVIGHSLTVGLASAWIARRTRAA